MMNHERMNGKNCKIKSSILEIKMQNSDFIYKDENMHEISRLMTTFKRHDFLYI